MVMRRLFICVLCLFSFVILSAVPFTFAAMNPPTLLAPEDGAWLDPNKMEFRWTAVEGALSYRVEITNDNFYQTFYIPCDDPALTLTCEACRLCKQEPGLCPRNPMIWHWQVYALGDNEEVSSESRVFSFNPNDITVSNATLSSGSNKGRFQLFQKLNK